MTITDDVIPVMRQLAGLAMPMRGKRARPFTRRAAQQFDLVVLDPPRWAKGDYGAVDVVRDYASLFKPALLATAPGGTVLATNHVPEVAREDWLSSLERCAAKAGPTARGTRDDRARGGFPVPRRAASAEDRARAGPDLESQKRHFTLGRGRGRRGMTPPRTLPARRAFRCSATPSTFAATPSD